MSVKIKKLVKKKSATPEKILMISCTILIVTWEMSNERPVFGNSLEFFFSVILINSKTFTNNKKNRENKQGNRKQE